MSNVISILKSNYKFLVAIALLWTALIILSFYTSIRGFEEHSIRLATKQALDYWNKDSAFRTWATRHGGLYVRPDERTPPNPSLAHIPQRDVVTTDGIKLTLMNPAYMMRQMTEEFEELYGIKGKITGQVLLDPKGKINKPDEWELKSLKQFDQGVKQVTQIASINNEPYLRLMRPMFMTAGCVLCHGHLGFNVGDIRGGVSVSVPLKPFEEENYSSRQQTKLRHLVIWVIGLLVLLYISYLKSREENNKRQAQEIIIRSQKMDALGKLTGGIAHDYNNMLGVVLGYAELLENSLKDNPDLASYASEIYHAGQRGTKLTRKLLSFAKKDLTEARNLDINQLLLNEKDMLEKTITPRIELKLELQKGLWPVWVDESDIEDAILNICINAMHAIKDNGKLTIQTSNQLIDATDAKVLGIEKGDYVLLSFTDNGCGMDDDTVVKIFEPFFSTKGKDGTGLGLSQVYGFINRSNGTITVSSHPGSGTQFSLYFPRHHSHTENNQPVQQNPTTSIKSKKNILVVDDEKALLNLTCETLIKNGYNVFPADNARQALDILKNTDIDIMLTDIIMPEMDGYQLSAIVKEKYPGLKIQLMSGFTSHTNKEAVDNELHKNLLHKPFSSEGLLQAIQKLVNNKVY